jgi:LPXTG-motif cell wall-anchored protein
MVAGAMTAASLFAANGVADAAPVCPEGAISVVTDDSGVEQVACVAVGGVPVVGPAGSIAGTEALAVASRAPSTVTTSLPQTGGGHGSLIIATLLVGSGSVASLISRRKR